jgi:hypothetical protein
MAVPPPLVLHSGKAIGHSALEAQSWRLPAIPQAASI